MVKLVKRLTTLLIASTLFSATFAQSHKEKITEYISKYKDLAMAEMLRTGVPASVTLAQGILETNCGQSNLANEANNHFGIKCKTEWTGETILHDDDRKNECFRKYASVEDSYRDHSDFLKSRPIYAFLFKLDPTDYEGWAKGLKKAGYATSSTYSQALVKLIVENNLQDYTLLALNGQNDPEELFAANAKEDEKMNTASFTVEQPMEIISPAVVKSMKKTVRVEKYPYNELFTLNDLKVVYASAGTSLLAVANNYNVTYKKLLDFNDLEELDILPNNQLIYLQKKSKKSDKEYHIVEEEESIHDISQKEGVQLSSIMEYNGLQKNMQPAVGEKIYLKFPAPVVPKLASASKVSNEATM